MEEQRYVNIRMEISRNSNTVTATFVPGEESLRLSGFMVESEIQNGVVAICELTADHEILSRPNKKENRPGLIDPLTYYLSKT